MIRRIGPLRIILPRGRDPEIAPLVEAGRLRTDGPSWSHGPARIGGARLRVSLDDREVADLPKPAVVGWQSTYFLSDRSANGLKH